MRSAARLLSILFLLSSFNALAQKSTARQKELEVQKQRLTSEIKQINTLLFKNTKKKKDVLSEVEDLNLKISVRSQLVNVNNQQANLLTRQISVNERDIGNFRKELTALKKDYAEMIRKSYKSKSSQHR
jgi:septal ring factor EnvC (AmiA/AmiB activator)